MTITREQVADIQPGDVVELARADDLTAKATGAVVELNGRLYVGPFAIRWQDGSVPVGLNRLTLTVVSRAPRPLYVNSDRTEPVPKDVVRDGEGVVRYVAHTSTGLEYWSHDYEPGWGWTHHSNPPKPLTLLVDGETGQVVP